MRLLKKSSLFLLAATAIAGIAYAATFDYTVPPLGSSQAELRNDLQLELTGINTNKLDKSGLTATAPLTHSSGNISTSIATNRLVGRFTAATGVMEQVTPDATTLLLDSTSLRVVDVTCTGCLGSTEIAALAAGDITTGTFADALVDGSLESDEVKPTVSFCVAISDEVTAITTGTAKITWRMPYAFTLTGIRGSLNTASSSGAPIWDVNEAGVTIMTTNKILIDVSEETSVTAATAPTLTDTSLADDAEMTIDVDTAGTGAKGGKVCLIGNRT